MTTTGVLVMAYGTPGSPEEIEPYYTRIRHGHAPTPELLADLTRRYEAIGGISPLKERTDAQVTGLRTALEERAPGRFTVAFGAKYTAPYVEDAARELAATCDTIIGLVLTPHQASLGSEQYHDRAREVLDELPCTYVPINSWYTEPGYADLQATLLAAAMEEAGITAEDPSGIVLFTAHSLPEKILAMGDPYPSQVAHSGELIAARLGLTHTDVAWQSAGRTRDPWIGPDILAVLPTLPGREITGVVVCPVGFVADHLEVLYDLDVEDATAAAALGLRFARTASLNARPEFLDVLASAVIAAEGTR